MSEPAERPGSADGYLSAFSGYHAPACPPSGLSVGATKARDGGEGEHSRDRGRPSIGDARGSCPGHLVLAGCPSGTDLSSSYFFRLFFFFFLEWGFYEGQLSVGFVNGVFTFPHNGPASLGSTKDYRGREEEGRAEKAAGRARGS